MFYKIGSTPILGVYQASGKFTKCAAKNSDIKNETDQQIRKSLNFLSGDVIKAVAKIYNISSNIDDYIFPVPRAVGADTPNSNGDRFAHEELTRYSPNHRCLVYQTFRNDPIHVEHAADNPRTARGFIPDAVYIQDNPKDRYVLTIAAIDTKKDSALAEALLKGDVNSFSMGCSCEAVQCSYSKCRKIAKSDKDLCSHLLHNKMRYLDGELIYEDCLGVDYQELSVVGDPAYAQATTQFFLQKAASRKRIQASKNFNLLSTLVSKEDYKEIARFFKENSGKLPEAMLKLADKLI